MQNILYVSHTSQVAGAEHSLALLLERLDRSRFSPIVALPGKGALTEMLDGMGVPYCPVPMGRLRRTRNPVTLLRYFSMWRRAITEIAKLFDEFGTHLVHSNSTTAHLFAGPAAKRAGLPCIWHVRDMSSPGGWLDTMMTKNATAIVAISGAVKANMCHRRLAEPKTTVIHNGVDVAKFAPGDPMAVRGELGLDASTPVAGIIGQVVPWKGHERFLDAAAKVTAAIPDARFLVVGDNRFGDFPGILDRLKERARELGIGDRVLFLGWRDDTVAVMNALDVLVLTSEDEPFGRVVVEAMACGKPVVSFRCGGPVEIIEHDRTGLLIAPFDTDEMAAGLVRLLSDRDESAAMGELAREAASEKFSAGAYADNVQDLYARLLR